MGWPNSGMTRELLSVALARQMGRTLTVELAKEIVREAEAEPDLAVANAKFVQERWRGYTFQCETLQTGGQALCDQRASYLRETAPGDLPQTDWARLTLLQRRGHHAIFTARQAGLGTLAASIWLFVDWNIDTGARCVTDDLMFVEPAHRGGMLAPRLWRYAEASMFAVGVREAVFHSRLENGAERMARFLGYRPIATRVRKTHSGDDLAGAPTRREEVFHDPVV